MKIKYLDWKLHSMRGYGYERVKLCPGRERRITAFVPCHI